MCAGWCLQTPPRPSFQYDPYLLIMRTLVQTVEGIFYRIGAPRAGRRRREIAAVLFRIRRNSILEDLPDKQAEFFWDCQFPYPTPISVIWNIYSVLRIQPTICSLDREVSFLTMTPGPRITLVRKNLGFNP